MTWSSRQRRAGHRRAAGDDPAEHGRQGAQLHGLAIGPRHRRPRQCPGRGGRSGDARRGAARRHGRGHPRLPGRQRGRPGGDAWAAAGRTPARSPSPPGSRPTAATSTPTSTGSTPPTRASCPRRASSTQVTFEEMLELAGVGAKVLQVRSVGLAMRENLPLRVLSAFEDVPGTEIVAELGADMERNAIAGIAADRNEARITLTGIADRPGMVAAVISAAGRGGHPGRHDRPRRDRGRRRAATSPSPSPRASLAQAVAVLEAAQGRRSASSGCITDDAVAKVSRSSGSASAPTRRSPRRCSRRWPSGRSTCSRSPPARSRSAR